MRSLLTCTIWSLALSLLTACPPGRRDGGDALAALDTDGDGDLDADDMDAGEGGILLTLDFLDADGEPDVTEEALVTTDIELQQTFSAWNLAATFGDGDDALTISLRFELEGDLEAGTYAVSSGSAQPGDQSWYGYASEAGGEVVISGVGDGVGSGHFEGEAIIPLLGEFEEATDEVVRITGFAFREASILLADM